MYSNKVNVRTSSAIYGGIIVARHLKNRIERGQGVAPSGA